MDFVEFVTTTGSYKLGVGAGLWHVWRKDLIGYHVMTQHMSTVFEGKITRLGNSMAVIIPKEILREVGANEGDLLRLSLPVSKVRQRIALRNIAGIDSQAKPFVREKRLTKD